MISLNFIKLSRIRLYFMFKVPIQFYRRLYVQYFSRERLKRFALFLITIGRRH